MQGLLLRAGRVGLVVLVLGAVEVGWGSTYLPDLFRTNARSAGGLYWVSQRDYAEWEFQSLRPGTGLSLSLEAGVFLSFPGGAGPAEVWLRVKVATLGAGDSRLYTLVLSRVSQVGDTVGYFGQLFLSTRELGLGSRLVVQVDGRQSGVPVGVASTSFRVSLPGSGTMVSALPGPATPATGAALASPDGRGGVDLPVVSSSAPLLIRTFAQDTHRANAVYVAPGSYRAELGWPGAPFEPDSEDCYKVNLRAGEVLSLRLEVPSGPCCILVLFDPSGNKVAEVEGNWMGLEYRAGTAGVWQVWVLCRESHPTFPYTLTVGIRTSG